MGEIPMEIEDENKTNTNITVDEKSTPPVTIVKTTEEDLSLDQGIKATTTKEMSTTTMIQISMEEERIGDSEVNQETLLPTGSPLEKLLTGETTQETALPTESHLAIHHLPENTPISPTEGKTLPVR